MASIQKIEGKKGITYKITVSCGQDALGYQIRHFMTYKPERDMTERQGFKAAQNAAYEFEKQVKLGYAPDNKQTFKQFAEYCIELSKQAEQSFVTTENLMSRLKRIYPYIGNMKLQDIRPQHLNRMYKSFAEEKAFKVCTKTAQLDQYINEYKEGFKISATRAEKELAERCGVSMYSFDNAVKGRTIKAETAERIEKGLQRKNLFKEYDNGGTKATTVHCYHSVVHKVLEQARREMIIQVNPASLATLPKLKKVEKEYLTPEKVKEVLAAADTEFFPPIKALIYTLVYTGMRRGEICGLTWDNIDLTSGEIRIEKALKQSSIDSSVQLGTTKTGNARTITAPEPLRRVLVQHRREQLERRFTEEEYSNPQNYVFTDATGKPIKPTGLYSRINCFCKRHKLEHINPHEFRHTAATLMIASGADIAAVSSVLGHNNIKTTLDVYTHAIEEHKEKALMGIDEMITKQAK